MKKNLLSCLFIGVIAFGVSLKAQVLNWENRHEEHPWMVSAGAGLEYGLVFGTGVGYQVKNTLLPLVLTAGYSLPSGHNVSDDFKTKFGLQARLFKHQHIHVALRLEGIMRRYENTFVRLLNFGSDMALTAGYYRKHWFVSAETGFDKAIVTHFKHAQLYKSQYPAVENGWFNPPTGGNFYYGIQAGGSFNQHEINIKTGAVLTQDFETTPLLPFYVMLGYNYQF